MFEDKSESLVVYKTSDTMKFEIIRMNKSYQYKPNQQPHIKFFHDITSIRCQGPECLLISDSIDIKLIRIVLYQGVLVIASVIETKRIPEGMSIVDSVFTKDKILALGKKIFGPYGVDMSDDYGLDMLLIFKRGFKNSYTASAISMGSIGAIISEDTRLVLHPKMKDGNYVVCFATCNSDVFRLIFRPQTIYVVDRSALDLDRYQFSFVEDSVGFGDYFEAVKEGGVWTIVLVLMCFAVVVNLLTCVLEFFDSRGKVAVGVRRRVVVSREKKEQ